MKYSSAKSKLKFKKFSNAVNFDYTWIFSNGSESEKNHRIFNHLKDILSKNECSRLVLKADIKNY
jgi:hypothetical protein